MDLSRRDAFRPCSRDSSGDKVNFVLLAKKNFFNWNRLPLPFPGYIYLPVQYGYYETRRDGSNPFIAIKSLFIL